MSGDNPPRIVSFGIFEVDLKAGELRRHGLKVKLQEQPLQVLAALLEQPGEVVTREELRSKLWPADTFVDFDHGLNAAVKRLRDALGESVETRILLVMILQMLISFFGIGLLHGLAPILASESFPTKFRYSGTGISYNLSGILGGMAAPSLLAALIGEDVFHRSYFVSLLYAFYSAAAMLALLFIRETHDLDLRELDQAEASLPIPLSPQKILAD